MPDAKKNVAFSFDLCLVDSANRPSFKANPTLSAGDFKVSTNESALTNVTDLPTVSPSASRIINVTLTASEMNGDRIAIQAVDPDNEWDEVVVIIDTTTVTVDDLVRSTTPANTLSVDASGRIDAGKLLGQAVVLDANNLLKVDVEDWRGTLADALSSGKVPADIKLWLTAAPAALTSSGYVQAMLLRWLTDNAAGTPSALSSNLVQSYIPGDVLGKVLGGGASSITGTGVQAQLQNPQGIRQNTALNNFEFKMYSSLTGAPTAGLTLTGTVSIDGAAYVALTNSATSLSSGTYKINLAAADLNGRVIMLRFTAALARDADIEIITVQL